MKFIRIKKKNYTKYIISTALFLSLCIVIVWFQSLNNLTPITAFFLNLHSTTVKTISASLSNAVNSRKNDISREVPIGVSVIQPMSAEEIGKSFGIAAGGGLSKISIPELNQRLDEMKKLGVEWVRFDIEWGNVQYDSPNNFTWERYDAVVDAIVARNMKPLAILLFTPEWARDINCKGGAKCPPDDPQEFATFAAHASKRYKNEGLHYWEIWNEPNNYDFWATKTNCVSYTALLKATYVAIKHVDENAVVITGGTSPAATNDVNISPVDFLECIYTNGGKDYFDAVAHHPYSFPILSSKNTAGAWAQMSLTAESLRSLMIKNGDEQKKIWMTEFGAPTSGPDSKWYVSEVDQAAIVIDALNLYKQYSWAGPFFWYSMKDTGTTTDTNENFFGLLRYDGSHKLSYEVLKSLIMINKKTDQSNE